MNAIEWCICAAIVLILAATIAPIPINMHAKSVCLSHGYPGHKVDYATWTAYCIKRMDQTDVVVPLP